MNHHHHHHQQQPLHPGIRRETLPRGITPWAKRVRSGMDGDTGCANTVQLYGERGEKEGFVGFGLAASRRQSFLQRQHLACAAVHRSIDSPAEASFRLLFLWYLFSFSPSETADGGWQVKGGGVGWRKR